MKNPSKALLCTAALLCASGAISSSIAGGTVPGWPTYLAMGAIGGPSVNDNFGGHPVDVVFKYAGVNGDGDPGRIDPPSNALRMTPELQAVSATNHRGTRVAIVEYTAQMSGGSNLNDFSNAPEPNPGAPTGSYILARHMITLGSDALAMNDVPVVYGGQNFYGSLILNPDLLGAIHQGSTGGGVHLIDQVNQALPAGRVNLAIDQALCFLTTTRSYNNTFDPNGGTGKAYQRLYNGTPVVILEQMLADGYPAYSIESQTDPYWNVAMNNLNNGTGNTYSQIGVWFNSCVANPTYNTTTYQRPNFPAGFEGWVQANNWIIRAMSAKGKVTFGWQENMWPVTNGFWMHKDLTDTQIASTYSTPIGDWIQINAPSAITTSSLGVNYVPDYFVFDRYEFDDSAAPGSATLYSARSWDNVLTAVGQISKRFNNIPIMLWQIPGGHIPYTGEAQPEIVLGNYIFSSAPVYFFGDSNLTANLGNMITGTAGQPPGTAVGAYVMDCSTVAYNCPAGYNYKQYLNLYKGQPNNFNWGQDNGRLKFAASNNVFSILWGGGNTTNVIKNFSNPDDHGWLSNKIIAYYQNPTRLGTALAGTHDFNGDGKSDIIWRDQAGNIGLWLMNGVAISGSAGFYGNPLTYGVVGQRDFDGDGKTDLLWRGPNGETVIWFFNGLAATGVGVNQVWPTSWSVAGTGDFDGDGKGDILWRNTNGDIAMWLMNGSTIKQNTNLGNLTTAYTIVAVADFDGDGKADIMFKDTRAFIAFWLMNGTTVKATAQYNSSIGTAWSIVGTGDFNGDGKADVLFRDTSSYIAIWIMNGMTIADSAAYGPIGTAWSVVETGDYNNDGKADIVLRDTQAHSAVWYMNGKTIASTGTVPDPGLSWNYVGQNAD